jgi:hypothetical protein
MASDGRAGEARLHAGFATRPVTKDQLATCRRILDREPSGGLMLMPTHHVNGDGDLTGFCYRCVDCNCRIFRQLIVILTVV